MDNKDIKTQDRGFEFSGESSSKDQKQSQPSGGTSGYQFETTTTAVSSEQQHKSDPENPGDNKRKNIIRESLPNSGGVLALGIISIVAFCCCYGIISVALGIIALVLAANANKKYQENPDIYTLSSVKNMRAGKICAIIGLSFAALIIIFSVIGLVSGLNIIGLEESLNEFDHIFNDTGY